MPRYRWCWCCLDDNGTGNWKLTKNQRSTPVRLLLVVFARRLPQSALCFFLPEFRPKLNALIYADSFCCFCRVLPAYLHTISAMCREHLHCFALATIVCNDGLGWSLLSADYPLQLFALLSLCFELFYDFFHFSIFLYRICHYAEIENQQPPQKRVWVAPFWLHFNAL